MSIGFRKTRRRPRLWAWMFGIAALLIMGGAIVVWRSWTNWTPSLDEYADQGVAVSADDGDIEWRSLRLQGASFAYIAATDGNAHRDERFADNWAGAKAAGLRYGAELRFNPCAPAREQATLFITTVARDNAALPPAIRLDIPEECSNAPGRDNISSALNTLINIVETHSGKPAVLHISKAFEDHYSLSSSLNRTLWLDSDYFEPSYADRVWVMWSASDAHRIAGISGPVEWVVVAP